MPFPKMVQRPPRVSKSNPPRNTVAPIVGNVSRGSPEVDHVPIDAVDWSFAVRSLNSEHLERLAGAARLPVIKVWEVQPGQFRGIDGYHRWRVLKTRGHTTLPVVKCHFAQGKAGERQFEIESIRSNVQHGLPFTKAERDRIIRRFWTRWRQPQSPGDEVTLEELGKLFNLTRQRVHQIIGAGKTELAPRRGGFSSFGRFSAATHRMSTLLTDSAFLRELLQERESEVTTALRELGKLIDGVLKQKAASKQ